MLTIRLALRNVARHRFRTGTVLGAIAFGVTGLILSGGFVHDLFEKLADALIRSQSGHLQVAKQGYFGAGKRSPEKFLLADPDGISARIAATAPGISSVMSRLSLSGLLNNGRSDLAVVVEGLETGKEAALGMQVRVGAGRQLAAEDRFAAVVGEGVANALQLSPGDRAVLIASTPDGALNTLDLEIVGVFQTISKDYDARAVKVPLKAAQELLSTSSASLIVVALDRTTDTNRVAEAIRSVADDLGLEVKAWHELSHFYARTVELYDRQFGILRLIVLMMVLLSVSNAVNMTVFERMVEFGTMRALGSRGREVWTLVIVENLILGLVGAGFGVVVGICLALLLSAIGIPMPPPPNANVGYTAEIRIVPSVVNGAFFVGVLATVLAAIFPALRVARMPVVEALRKGV